MVMPAIDAASDAGLAPRLHPSRRRGQGAAADGYDRWSTLLQDLTSQREVLTALGIPVERICLDKGLTGINRARISLDQTLAAVPAGDTHIAPKLGRLGWSFPDTRGVHPSLGGSIYDPADPMSKMFFKMRLCSPSSRPTC
jgi:hypothetical protein